MRTHGLIVDDGSQGISHRQADQASSATIIHLGTHLRKHPFANLLGFDDVERLRNPP
jgi:hypothetical protein